MKEKLPKGVKAALIDMDGVLYDSMPHHAAAWQRIMTGHGFHTDIKEFYLYEGMTGAGVIDLVTRRQLGRPATEEEKRGIYEEKSRLFAQSGENKPIEGAARMLAALERAGIVRVLVTGSGQGTLLDKLDTTYPGAFPKDRRVTAKDVKRGKPDPEPYLMGAAKAGVCPSECIVIENAPLGVRAGKASGAFTIAVTTGPIPREEFEKEDADMIFPSMTAFAEWLENAFNP